MGIIKQFQKNAFYSIFIHFHSSPSTDNKSTEVKMENLN